jgi:hypothetical protein
VSLYLKLSSASVMTNAPTPRVDFHVSEGFLIKLYRASTTTATLNTDLNEAASHSTDSDTVKNSELHCDSEILTAVYLVEPRRASTAVHKYSGTLGVSSRIDKKSATMMAFSHFVLESTACTYMFADIQGENFGCFGSRRFVLLTW